MRLRGQFGLIRFFAPDGEGDGGSGDGDGGAPSGGMMEHAESPGEAANKTGDGAPQPNGAGDAPTPYYPEGIDEALRGQSDQETLDNLAKALSERRNGNPDVKLPEKPEDYKLDLSDELKAQFGDMKDDPVLPIYQEIAHKHGLTNETFNALFTDFHAQMTEAGLIEPPVDYQGELSKLEPSSGDPASKKAHAAQRLHGAMDWIQGLETRGVLTAEEAINLSSLVNQSAIGVTAIEKLRNHASPTGVQPGGAPAHQRGMEAIRADMRSPKYDSASNQFDPAFRKRVDDEFRQAYEARN